MNQDRKYTKCRWQYFCVGGTSVMCLLVCKLKNIQLTRKHPMLYAVAPQLQYSDRALALDLSLEQRAVSF